MAGQSTPKIRRDNATGAAYSGNVQIRNLNSVFFTGNAPFVGVIDTECQFADLRGHVNSDGTGGAITSVQIDNNGSGAACPNNKGGTTTITAVNVNGTGTVYYDPDHPGGRDGYLFLSGNNPNVKIKAVITMADIPDPQTCYYGLTGGAPDLYIDIWNKDNGSRPDTSVTEAEGQANGQEFYLITTETNGPYCPDAAAAYVDATVKGEVTANSGTFDQTLYITPA